MCMIFIVCDIAIRYVMIFSWSMSAIHAHRRHCHNLVLAKSNLKSNCKKRSSPKVPCTTAMKPQISAAFSGSIPSSQWLPRRSQMVVTPEQAPRRGCSFATAGSKKIPLTSHMAEWPVTFKIRSLIQCRFSSPWLLSPSERPFQLFWESAGVLKMTSSCVIVCPNSCLKEKTKGNMIQLAHHSVYMMWVIQILGRTFWFKQLFETQQKVEPNRACSISTSLWSKNLVSQVELWWSRYNKSPQESSTSE